MSQSTERSEETAALWGKLLRTPPDASAEALAGAVAHDLNNMLTGLLTGLDLLDAALDDGRADAARAEVAVLREAGLRLLAMSRALEARAAEAPPRARPAPPPDGRGGVESGRGRVLVIDDEPSLRDLVGEALAGAYEVVPLASPREALARIVAGERFDVILCDLMLPDLDGPAMHDILRGLAPRLAESLVFMTGGAFTARARAFLAGHPGPTLAKPFGLPALRDAVAAAAARASGAPAG